MDTVPVQSSNIRAIGYDADSRTLQIDFKSGGRYQYPAVEPATHVALMASPSKGSFFSRNMRKLPYVKLATKPEVKS